MQTFYNGFRERALRRPEGVAVEVQRPRCVESHTYAELRHMAESVGRWLTGQGLGRGARVAILADNGPRWFAAYLGVLAAGCVAVPLDTTFSAEQVAKLLQDSGSALLFCDAKHLAVAEEAVGSAIGIVLTCEAGARGEAGDGRAAGAQVETTFDELFTAGPGDFAPASSDDEDLACILYTSGTTADPKGVMLSHSNLMAEAHAAFAWAHFDHRDAVLGVLPLFHVLAQMTNLVVPLLSGGRVVYLETLNSAEMLRALSEREITVLSVVPQFFYLIHERIFREVAARGRLALLAFRALMTLTRSARALGWNAGKLFFPKVHRIFGGHMRHLLSAGSRFDPQVARDLGSMGIDVLQAYGLTETTGAAFATRPGKMVLGSVGPPLAGMEGRVVDARADEGVGHAVGEIAIRGPLVMKGYWKRPDATAAVLRDGWLHTGDLGYFDAEGNLFITGRKKEVIILGNGKNIYPEEVEAHYLKSPLIKEVCVLGLEARPGDPASDRLHAVVVPDFDALRQRKIVNVTLSLRFDIEGLSVQLPPAKRIGSYEIWRDELPRTTTRKIKRFEVERRVRAGRERGAAAGETAAERPLGAEDAAWMEEPDVRRALAVIRKVTRMNPDAVQPDANLELDLGLDSLQRIELAAALEKELGGQADESRLSEVYTARQLVDLIRQGSTGVATRAETAQPAGWRKILAGEPSNAEVLALGRPQQAKAAFWFLLTRLLSPLVRVCFRLRVEGLENVPRRGPLLICPNHQSAIDALVMSVVLPWPIFRELFIVGTSEFFGTGVLRTLARALRIVVVDPDANLIPAMRAGAFGLRRGRVLLLFPEGERSIDGTPKVFRKGAAILSIHTQAPIVPAALEGFHDAWPRGKPFQRFAPLRIRFGTPIHPPPESEASAAAYEKLAAELRARVSEMWDAMREDGRAVSLGPR